MQYNSSKYSFHQIQSLGVGIIEKKNDPRFFHGFRKIVRMKKRIEQYRVPIFNFVLIKDSFDQKLSHEVQNFKIKFATKTFWIIQFFPNFPLRFEGRALIAGKFYVFTVFVDLLILFILDWLYPRQQVCWYKMIFIVP